MATGRVLSVMCSVVQLLAVVFLAVALFTNQWIRNVKEDSNGEGDTGSSYFKRVNSLPYGTFISAGTSGFEDGIYTSVGLFRIWTTGSNSYPLPIVDPPLKMCKGGILSSLLVGAAAFYTCFLQVFGFFNGIFPLEVLLFWITFCQVVLTFTGVLVGTMYFKNNFSYDNGGVSLFSGWIAFCLVAVLLVLVSFKLYFAHGEATNKRQQKEQLAKQSIYEKPTLRSAGSQNRLYQPAPQQEAYKDPGYQYPTSFTRETSRPGTMQSQHRYETEMRYESNEYPPQEPSYSFRQQSSTSHGFTASPRAHEYMYNDVGDIPRQGSYGQL